MAGFDDDVNAYFDVVKARTEEEVRARKTQMINAIAKLRDLIDIECFGPEDHDQKFLLQQAKTQEWRNQILNAFPWLKTHQPIAKPKQRGKIRYWTEEEDQIILDAHKRGLRGKEFEKVCASIDRPYGSSHTRLRKLLVDRPDLPQPKLKGPKKQRKLAETRQVVKRITESQQLTSPEPEMKVDSPIPTPESCVDEIESSSPPAIEELPELDWSVIDEIQSSVLNDSMESIPMQALIDTMGSV